MNVIEITEVWLHNCIQTRKGNGLGRQTQQIPFKKRKFTNRNTPKHPTCKLHPRQNQHNKAALQKETPSTAQFTTWHSMVGQSTSTKSLTSHATSGAQGMSWQLRMGYFSKVTKFASLQSCMTGQSVSYTKVTMAQKRCSTSQEIQSSGLAWMLT